MGDNNNYSAEDTMIINQAHDSEFSDDEMLESFEAFEAREHELHEDHQEIPLHVQAARLKSRQITWADLWPDIIEVETATSRRTDVNLCASKRGDLLTQLSINLSDSIQFPSSTCWLHGLGCIASAMTKGFTFTYYQSKKPVNLYIVTAQPPSTGKSAINGLFSGPIIDAYDELNRVNRPKRIQINRTIAGLEKTLKTTKKMDHHEEIEIIDKLLREEGKLADCPEWNSILDDVTIEAAENVAKNQKGMFNIISAEAEAINVVTGGVYGDDKGGKKANYGLLLKAWDGERNSSLRIGREGYTGIVKSTICVIAQDDSVDTILAAGASGRGLAERFLLLAERSKLGERDFSVTRSINTELHDRYKSLIRNIINQPALNLSFSPEALDVINCYKINQEKELADDGKYSHNLLTGFIGKCDKQIMKIASILHVIDHWQDGVERSKIVGDNYAYWGLSVFDELAKTYINAADVMGYVGDSAELLKLADIFQDRVEKKKLKTSIEQLRSTIKRTAPFKGLRNLTKKLKRDLLPKLERNHYCVVVGNTIYINPKL